MHLSNLTITILTPLLLCDLHAQDCHINHQFDDLKAQYDLKCIDLINELDTGRFHGTSTPVLVLRSLDTLNKESIIPTKFVEGTSPVKTVRDLAGANSQISNDTLFILIGYILGSEEISHKVYADRVDITYSEWFKHDLWLKINEHDSPTNRITVPTHVEIYDTCREGNILWGHVKFKTHPYYKLDRYNSRQFLRIQQNYEYYFKLRI